MDEKGPKKRRRKPLYFCPDCGEVYVSEQEFCRHWSSSCGKELAILGPVLADIMTRKPRW